MRRLANDIENELGKKLNIEKDEADADQLTEIIIQLLRQLPKKSKLILVIDEIDNFSKSESQNQKFKHLLSLLSKITNLKTIGIANSVELFRGEIKKQEVAATKIVFDPYTKDDMRHILFYLIKNSYETLFKLPLDKILKPIKIESENPFAHLLLLFDLKALELCAARIDKLSGDLRSCF